MAANSGDMINWNDALQSNLQLAPEINSWDQEPPILPDDRGIYPFGRQGDHV